MKTFFLAMLVCGSSAPLIIADISPTAAYVMEQALATWGGVLGAGICFCKEGIVKDNFTKMARISMGNVLVAATFGPTVSYWFCRMTGFPSGSSTLVPIGAVLGIGGVSLIASASPIVQSGWKRWLQSKSDTLTGPKRRGSGK